MQSLFVKYNLSKENAFSLVEILIVIALIGVMVVVTLVWLKPQEIFVNTRNARRIEDIDTLNSALGHWLSREGLRETDRYATLSLTDNGVGAMVASNGIDELDGIGTETLDELVNSGYLFELPHDPIDSNLSYRVGVDDLTTPQHIVVCTGEIEISTTYPEDEYPEGVFCLSN